MDEVIGQKVIGQLAAGRQGLTSSQTHPPSLSKCPICGLHIEHQTNMARHMKTHTGERQHKCITCGKMFSRTDSLKRHMFTHYSKELNSHVQLAPYHSH